MAERTGQGKSRRMRSYEIEGDAKIIPIDRETREAISKQEQLFREKFGREPGPEDPLFFDPDASTPQFCGGGVQGVLRFAQMTNRDERVRINR